MGRVAKVISVEGEEVKVDPEDPSMAEHFADPGDASLPLPGDVAALEDSSGSGVEQAVGYHDPNVTRKPAGEKYIYGRSSAGTKVAEIWLKGDGTVVLKSLLAPSGGTVQINPDGTVNINGVIVSALGKVTALLDVVAANAVPAVAVGLQTHVHLTPMGPSGPPTPGT